MIASKPIVVPSPDFSLIKSEGGAIAIMTDSAAAYCMAQRAASTCR
jgi:hypothetical protein